MLTIIIGIVILHDLVQISVLKPSLHAGTSSHMHDQIAIPIQIQNSTSITIGLSGDY